MSALLDIVSEGAELLKRARLERDRAIVRARQGKHTLEEIGRAAGLKKAGIAYILKREENEK